MKTEPTINLTEMERKLIIACVENQFNCGTADDVRSAGTWTWNAIEESGLNPKQARGVIASLIKKGLATEYDNEGRGRADDFCLNLTKAGIEAYRSIAS